MRNLKKVLALALAVVMLVGMMVVGASAATYTDTVGNDFGTAIEVVSAIEAIQGNGGKFNPDGRLTRGDAAVIAARVALTKGVASKLVGASGVYNDVSAKAYYSGAIAWATNEGYLSGDGTGNFRPTGSLYGIHFAKMLLGVLGYDAEIEGFTGKDYVQKIMLAGTMAGLFDGLEDVELNGRITRGQAAQMAYNALTATMVRYTGGSNITIGDVTINQGAIRSEVAEGTYDSYLYKNGTAAGDRVATDGLQLIEKMYPNMTLTTYDSVANVPAYAVWENQDVVIGDNDVASETTLTYTTINAKTDLSKLTDIAGLKYSVNGAALTNLGAETVADSNDNINALCLPGYTVEICVDDKTIVDVKVSYESLAYVRALHDDLTDTYTFTVANVSGDVTNTTVTLDKVEPIDNRVYDLLVSLNIDQVYGDNLLVTTKDGVIMTAEIATPVTGVATKFAEDGSYFVVGGTTYPTHANLADDGIDFGNTYLYLDSKGNVLNAGPVGTQATTGYIFVTGFTSTPAWEGGQYVAKDFKAVGFDLNGEAVEVAVTKTFAETASNVGKLFTYGSASYDAATKTYTLSEAALKLPDNYVNSKSKYETISGDKYFYNNDVKFLFVGQNDQSQWVVTGEATGVTGTSGYGNATKGVLYFVVDRDDNITNVVVLGTPYVAANYDLFYVGKDGLTASYYTLAADGVTKLAHFELYQSGVKTEIVQADLTAQYGEAQGFYYSTEANGLTTLVDYTTKGATVKLGMTLTAEMIKYVNGEYYLLVDGNAIPVDDAVITSLVKDVNINSMGRLEAYANSPAFTSIKVDLCYHNYNGWILDAIYVVEAK